MAQTSSQREQKILEALTENWQAEMRGFHTYDTLAERDDDAVRQKTLRHMAEAEAQHAADSRAGRRGAEVRWQADGGC
jgi:rubrerythrin